MVDVLVLANSVYIGAVSYDYISAAADEGSVASGATFHYIEVIFSFFFILCELIRCAVIPWKDYFESGKRRYIFSVNNIFYIFIKMSFATQLLYNIFILFSLCVCGYSL